MRRVASVIASLLLVALLASACGTSAAGEQRWRGLRVTAPEGWVVHEKEDTRFAISDAPFGTQEEPGAGEVGAFFTYEPGASADAWRDLIEQEGWTLELDEPISIDGSPATRLVFEHTGAETPLREMVVVLPSRDVVMLFQAAVLRGQTDGPEIFDRHRTEFEQILRGIRLGAPVG